jgi:hypothetical protein
MSKPSKKPTNKEIVQMLYTLHSQLTTVNNSVNVIGQTVSDYIDYKKDESNFLIHLKEKYKNDEKKT